MPMFFSDPSEDYNLLDFVQVIGIGAGQQSRIHCTRLAGDKANNWLAIFMLAAIIQARTTSFNPCFAGKHCYFKGGFVNMKMS